MRADEYLQRILQREAVDTGLYSPVRGVQTTIQPIIQEWAGTQLAGVSPSGSVGLRLSLYQLLSGQSSFA